MEKEVNREQSVLPSDTYNTDQYATMECGFSEEEDETNVLKK